MVNLQSVIIPGIIIGITGGILLFFLAYNYYPHKNVNINLNGKCYEFLDLAYEKYKDLEFKKERELLKMQIEAIGSSENVVPIIFSGSSKEVNNLIENINISITNRQILGANNSNIDKIIVRGNVTNGILEEISADLYKNTSGSEVNTILSNIGILPNSDISAEESHLITQNIDLITINGLKQIISESDGVKDTECRSSIVYRDE